ncbi:transcription factor bHLH106-like [Magnolia sinica]|uniref:transcription factor bHLH106-like n=1 Tax=Magnolia sinica TaxID=86752 RepID=UPI00265AD92F|nr:transcription factor bHLH106-like [Magnolia sinica]
MQPENSSGMSEIYRILTHTGMPRANGPEIPTFFPTSFCASDMSGITELPQARALAAKNHKEAEKRRRERIKGHLDELRRLLPCNSKTDKASLLAKVVQRVRDLKQQTSDIAGSDIFPSETDEISVFSDEFSSDGRSIFKASVCCEDRSDLLPDLIETLNSLHLRTLKAEMAMVGGRVRNVLVVAGDRDFNGDDCTDLLRDALKALVERSDSSDRCKRQRIFDRRTMK